MTELLAFKSIAWLARLGSKLGVSTRRSFSSINCLQLRQNEIAIEIQCFVGNLCFYFNFTLLWNKSRKSLDDDWWHENVNSGLIRSNEYESNLLGSWNVVVIVDILPATQIFTDFPDWLILVELISRRVDLLPSCITTSRIVGLLGDSTMNTVSRNYCLQTQNITEFVWSNIMKLWNSLDESVWRRWCVLPWRFTRIFFTKHPIGIWICKLMLLQFNREGNLKLSLAIIQRNDMKQWKHKQKCFQKSILLDFIKPSSTSICMISFF